MSVYEQAYKDLCEKEAALRRIVALLVRYADMTAAQAIRFVLWLD